jgi:hypothetical protein
LQSIKRTTKEHQRKGEMNKSTLIAAAAAGFVATTKKTEVSAM